MPSIYLKCDVCGETFDGEGYRPRGFRYGEGDELRREAWALGWTGPLCRDYETERKTGVDRCPKCSNKILGEAFYLDNRTSNARP